MATISRVLPYALILLVAHVGAAAAGVCGDDVGGQRVACACGDTIVSDVRLQRSDPVATGACPDDGLIVDAAAGVESLTVDLGGLGLVGSGSGIGIQVRDGGADGAYLIGGPDGRPGQIAGFRVGVSARASRGLRGAANLIVSGNEQDGLQVSGRGATLSGVIADQNGRSGISARGRDHALEGVSASDNGRSDLHVTGNSNVVTGSEVQR